MEAFLATGGGILLVIGWQLIRAYDRRQEERRAAIKRGDIVEPAPVTSWADGWVRPQRVGELTTMDWVLALGSLAAVIAILAMGVVSVITG